MATLGERLKELRIAKHLTQQQLADKIGVAKNTISVYESGTRKPSYEVLEALSDYFNVDVGYLLGKEDVSTRYLTSDEMRVIDNMRDNSEVQFMGQHGEYYMDKDARELAEFLFRNPEYKALFDASRKVKKEDLEFVRQMIERMGGTD